MGYKLSVREFRQAKGMTQLELANAVGVTERVIGAWEREETPLPIEYAAKISKVLGCTPNDLCGWSRKDGEAHNYHPVVYELITLISDCTEQRRRMALKTIRDFAKLSNLEKQDGEGELSGE